MTELAAKKNEREKRDAIENTSETNSNLSHDKTWIETTPSQKRKRDEEGDRQNNNTKQHKTIQWKITKNN